MSSEFIDWDALSDDSYPLGKTTSPLLVTLASVHELSTISKPLINFGDNLWVRISRRVSQFILGWIH